MMAEETHTGLRKNERYYQSLGEVGALRLRIRATAKTMMGIKDKYLIFLIRKSGDSWLYKIEKGN